LIVARLPWFRPLAVEDALAVLPEYLCDHIFRLGLTPYDPVCIIPRVAPAKFSTSAHRNFSRRFLRTKKYRTSSIDTHRISPAVFYGLKK
jgi:hypothetical protein